MVNLLNIAQKYVDDGKVIGIRMSTRPDYISKEIIQVLKNYTITYVELGIQSMNDEILQKNLRGHTAADVENAVQLIRQHSFELGLQFMPGLFGDTTESIFSTMEEISRQ